MQQNEQILTWKQRNEHVMYMSTLYNYHLGLVRSVVVVCVRERTVKLSLLNTSEW